ncbi:MAG: ribbon-helix-helix protein, CopG family [Acidimicrobiia bacterium]|nr:ribbon-helix-helix protein, CopG family [Acidimicrobiia bacterium]
MFMTTPVPTRFSDDELALLDELVAAGVGDNRSAVVRRAVLLLADRVRRTRAGATIARSYRELPQSAEDDALALANAIAMTEAEPW